ncbi:MAG: hypothetical protein WBG37_06905 [Desulfobacterales bacterium]
MNIIVCAKQLQHTYARTGTSPERCYIDPQDGIRRVNPHDEAALELALRLKEQHDGTTVILLTLGPMIAESEMRRCMAAGADHLCQLNYGQAPAKPNDPLDQPDPWLKSNLLARAVKELQGDLVLCGKASIDTGNGQVGALIAHHLEWPFISAITDLSAKEAGGLFQVQRSAGRGVREIIECPQPAVFSVDLGMELRFPRFDNRTQADAYPLRKFDYDANGETPRMVRKQRFQPRPRPKLVPAPDSRRQAYERIMKLLTGSAVEKKGEILTGTPESQVEGIIAFLKLNGFLESDDAAQ